MALSRLLIPPIVALDGKNTPQSIRLNRRPVLSCQGADRQPRFSTPGFLSEDHAVQFDMPVRVVFQEVGLQDQHGNAYLAYFFTPA